MRRTLELHRQYGSVVRVGPNDLIYCSPQGLRDVWGHRTGHEEFSKSDAQLSKPPNGAHGILSADKDDHRRYRKLLLPSFSDKSLKEQEPKILERVDKLVEQLRHGSRNGSVEDMTLWFTWTFSDIIGSLAFGEPFGSLESKATHPWISNIFNNIKAMTMVWAMKRLEIDAILPYITPKKAMELRLQALEYSASRLKKRIPLGTNNGDFWDGVLQKDGEEGGMTFNQMVTNASHMVLGGSETGATTLTGAMYFLLTHPQVMSRATSEVRKKFESDKDMAIANVADLPYTLAVIEETMRLYPAVPSLSARLVPPGGDTVDGKFLPAGTSIHFFQYAANRLNSNYKHAEEWHPERFLREGDFKNDNFDAFSPFSTGPRNCIGQTLAYAEMKLIVAKLLWHFDFELDQRTGDWLDQKIFTFWQKKPLLVKVTERRL